MCGKIVLLLLLIFLTIVTALGNSSLAFFGLSSGMGSISLEGNDVLLMPKMNFPEGAVGMELFDSISVYALNQSITGAFLSPHQEGASNISMCISPFNLSFYVSDNREMHGFSGKECAKTNGTSFLLTSGRSGIYSLNFVDEDRSSVLMAVPLLITEGQTVLKVPSIVNANEPFIQVEMNTTVPGNQSKFFVVIMMSRKDYENASLDIAKNNTINIFDITLSLGSKSLQIQSPPKISSEFLMDLLALLPTNSAVGLQESTQPRVDLILLPEKSWAKGEYILTGGIYSPGKGLLGTKQSDIEII